MKLQPLDVVRRPPRAQALLVAPDTLETLARWLELEATDGTRANLIGPSGGAPAALYLDHRDASGSHRCAEGEVIVVDVHGRVTLYPTDEAFRLDWDRPERGQ